jgi:hypothetical protein
VNSITTAGVSSSSVRKADSDSGSSSSGSNAGYLGGYVRFDDESAAAAAARMLPDDVVLSVGYQQMLD